MSKRKRILKPLKAQGPKVNRAEKFAEQYRKCMDGKHRTLAIRVYCLKCCNWQPAEVRACVCKSCPLYPYRLAGKPEPHSEVDANYYPHPERCHDQFVKAVTGKSRKWAVRTACRLCSSWEDAEVRDCEHIQCPLWQYRLTGTNKPSDAKVAAARKRVLNLKSAV